MSKRDPRPPKSEVAEERARKRQLRQLKEAVRLLRGAGMADEKRDTYLRAIRRALGVPELSTRRQKLYDAQRRTIEKVRERLREDHDALHFIFDPPVGRTCNPFVSKCETDLVSSEHAAFCKLFADQTARLEETLERYERTPVSDTLVKGEDYPAIVHKFLKLLKEVGLKPIHLAILVTRQAWQENRRARQVRAAAERWPSEPEPVHEKWYAEWYAAKRAAAVSSPPLAGDDPLAFLYMDDPAPSGQADSPPDGATFRGLIPPLGGWFPIPNHHITAIRERLTNLNRLHYPEVKGARAGSRGKCTSTRPSRAKPVIGNGTGRPQPHPVKAKPRPSTQRPQRRRRLRGPSKAHKPTRRRKRPRQVQ